MTLSRYIRETNRIPLERTLLKIDIHISCIQLLCSV